MKGFQFQFIDDQIYQLYCLQEREETTAQSAASGVIQNTDFRIA
jgi:hypothetical protein